MEIKTTPDITLTEQEKAEAAEGIGWLKSWLTERNKTGKFKNEADGKFEECMDKLDKVTIRISNNHHQQLMEELRAGTLHLTEEAIETYGKGDPKKAIENFEEFHLESLSGKNVAGQWVEDIAEPTVFINLNLCKDVEHGLSSIITHEATHLLGIDKSELISTANIIGDNEGLLFENGDTAYIKENISKDDYWDSSEEIYARIMQMRSDLGLEPTKIYTPEDVAKIREQALKAQEKYEQDLKTDPNTLRPREIPTKIISRYTDEQISFLLNETADLGKQSGNDLKADMSLYAQTTFDKMENITFPADNRDTKTAMQQDAQLAFAKSRVMENTRLKTPAEKSPTPQTKQTTLSPEMMAMRLHNNQYA